MSIQISCSAPPFVAQKARKLLIPVPIILFAPFGITSRCRVRVSFLGSSLGGLSIQAIPGTWDALSTTSVESHNDFDPNQPIPLFTAFPAFFDGNNPTAPTTGYSATYQVEVFDSSNVQQGSIQFVVSGNATPAQSVNVVFVLDHGSTMTTTDASGASRLARLKAAFARGVALLRDDDTLGVASFGNLRCSMNPQLAPAFATSAQQSVATTLANDLAIDTSAPAVKCIQMGIDAGRSLSTTATLVLITDGTNTNAAGHVLTTPSLPTSALIIGEDPNQIPTSASKMVSSSGHYAFASAQTLGDFAIEKLLTQVLINLAGNTFISDPEGTLKPGESQSFPFHITEADHELEVIVFSNDAKLLKVHVEVPVMREQGSCYQRHQPHGEPPPIEGEGYLIKRVLLPTLPQERDEPPQVIISRIGPAPDGNAIPVRFNLLVVAKTDLRLNAKVTASGLSVGSDLLFSAVVSEYGFTGGHHRVNVHVQLTHPDGFTQTIVLEQCAPGRFQASLRSFREGVYTAHFIATGESLLRRRAFRRENVQTVAVYPPGECCTAEDPCALNFARA